MKISVPFIPVVEVSPVVVEDEAKMKGKKQPSKASLSNGFGPKMKMNGRLIFEREFCIFRS